MAKNKIDDILEQIDVEEKNKINSLKRKYSEKKKLLVEKQKEKALKKIHKTVEKLTFTKYTSKDITYLINLIKDFDNKIKAKKIGDVNLK